LVALAVDLSTVGDVTTSRVTSIDGGFCVSSRRIFGCACRASPGVHRRRVVDLFCLCHGVCHRRGVFASRNTKKSVESSIFKGSITHPLIIITRTSPMLRLFLVTMFLRIRKQKAMISWKSYEKSIRIRSCEGMDEGGKESFQ
jgi:hypothetical protein